MAKHGGKIEMWINARAIVNRGWLPLPKHAEPGRHAEARASVVSDILTVARYTLRATFNSGRLHAAHAEHVSALGLAR